MGMENQSLLRPSRTSDRKLIMDALMKRCDAKDGIDDGMISDPLACDFYAEMLACKAGENNSCLAPE